MKIKCTRDSRWGNAKGGGPQSFKQDQVLVVGEDVNEFRAEDMLRCDYAEKVGEPTVKETKASTETDLTASETTLSDHDTEEVGSALTIPPLPLAPDEMLKAASGEITTPSNALQEGVEEEKVKKETNEEGKEEKPSAKPKKKGSHK